jgi:TetR/AcrR family transcriptional regulator
MIVTRAAELFAAQGYDRTTIVDIAEACQTSKALLYHYYDSKETILTDIIRSHLSSLLNAVHSANNPDLPPRERLRVLVGALLGAYHRADLQHKIQINEAYGLPPEIQSELKSMERELIAIFADAVAQANPDFVADNAEMLKPLTMSLFGMMNWYPLWFRAQGAVSRDTYADLVTTLIVDGSAAYKPGK